jgi:hypothetical protein
MVSASNYGDASRYIHSNMPGEMVQKIRQTSATLTMANAYLVRKNIQFLQYIVIHERKRKNWG